MLESNLDLFINKNIKDVNDLLQWMQKEINYGFIDKNFKKYREDFDDLDFYKNYYLQSPNLVYRNKIGVCWDQVEFIRYVLNKKHILNDVCFIIKNNLVSSTHTFVIYQIDSKLYYFENAFEKYRGIYGPFSKINDIIEKVNNQMDAEEGVKYSYNFTFLDKMKQGLTCEEYLSQAKKGRNKSILK